MREKSCDIMVCVNAKRPGAEDGFSGGVLDSGEGWGRWPHDAEDGSQLYDMYWVGERRDPGRPKKGGICVIFKPILKPHVNFPNDHLADNFGNLGVDDKPNFEELNESRKINVLLVVIETVDGPLNLICCYVPDSSCNKNNNNNNNKLLADVVFEKIDQKVKNLRARELVVIAGHMNAIFKSGDIKEHAR